MRTEAKQTSGTASAIHKLALVAQILGWIWLCAPPAMADVSHDAQKVGHSLGSVAHKVGHNVKHVAIIIGHDAKKAGVTIGHAAKAGGLAFWHAAKGSQ
ncbi:MAG TPA: hypothetical protein VMV40_05930 [Acidiferrobacter sp.]|nr:hypothetical protein [Acidiferrobacter sp.]